MNIRTSLLSTVLAAGLIGAAAPASAQEDDTLRMVIAAPMQVLNPQRITSVLAASVLKLAVEQLTIVGTEGTVQPLLAESWEVEEGGLSWLVTLREGVIFHDGTPFDAEAAVANFEYLMTTDVPIPGRTHLGPISGAEVVDEHTIRVTTTEPFSGFPIALSHYAASMLSPASLANGAADSGSEVIAGTGPFKMESFQLPDRVTLVRNKNYWGGAPGMARIEAISRADEQTRLATFLSGEADAVFYISPEGLRQAESDPSVKTEIKPAIRQFLLQLPFGMPVIQDKNVRLAMNHAIDREQIVETVYRGAASPAMAAIGPGVIGFREEYVYSYDPDKALALLAESGWTPGEDGILEKDGEDFPAIPFLASRGRYPSDARLSQIVAGYLRQIGIPTDLRIEEFATFFADARAGAQEGNEMVQMSWGFPQMDGAAFLCAVYRPGETYNFGAYQNETVEQACNAIDATFDAQERAQIIADANKAVYDDAGAVFLISNSYIVGMRDNISGIELHSGESHRYQEAMRQ